MYRFLFFRVLLCCAALAFGAGARAQSNWFYFPEAPQLQEHSGHDVLYAVPVDSIIQVQSHVYPEVNWMQQPTYVVRYGSGDSMMTHAAPGYYLVLRATNGNIEGHIARKASMYATINDIEAFKVLKVTDAYGLPMKTATVWYNRKELVMDPQLQGYKINKIRNNDWIEIRNGNDALFFYGGVEKNPESFSNTPRNYYEEARSQNQEFSGYMVTNKPQYMPGDTVKYKAYLQYANLHEPVRAPLQLTFKNDDDDDKTYVVSTHLLPHEPGVYYGEFILGDTVDAGALYTLRIEDSTAGRHLTQQFRLDDYLLDQTFLRVTGEDVPGYQPGDSVHLHSFAFTANGLPVLDGKLEVTVLPQQFNMSPDSAAFVPDTLVHYTIAVNPAGDTYTGFSTVGFPKEVQALHCILQLQNSNFEAKDTSFTLSITPQHAYLRSYQEGNKIRVVRIRNKQSVPGTGYYVVYTGTYSQRSQPVTFPYEYVASENDQIITFYSDTTEPVAERSQTMQYIGASQLAGVPSFLGDTASLQLHNPQGALLRYTIYVGDKYSGYGSTTTTDTLLKVYSKKGRTVTVICAYTWVGQEQERRFSIYKLDRELEIALHKKDIVFPGQEDSLTVHLSDKDNHAIPATNVTVLAFNSQFTEDYTPDMPYSGSLRQAFIHGKKISTISPFLIDLHDFPKKADKQWLGRCLADTEFYYRELYLLPHDVAWMQYPIPDTKDPQIAVYIRQGNEYKMPATISVDGRPAYVERINSTNPNSLFVKEGEHTITFRTAVKEYSIYGMPACAGMKTIILFNADSAGAITYYTQVKKKKYEAHTRYTHLYPFIQAHNMPDTFDFNERERLAASLLTYSNEREIGYTPWLVQGDIAIAANANYNNYTTYNTGRGYHSLYLVGPFNLNDSIYYYQRYNTKLRFQPEVHEVFSFRPGMMRLERREVYKDISYHLTDGYNWPAYATTAPNPIDPDTLLVNDVPVVPVVQDGQYLLTRHYKKKPYYAFQTLYIKQPDSVRKANLNILNKDTLAVKKFILQRDDHPADLLSSYGYIYGNTRVVPGSYHALVVWNNDSVTEYHNLQARAFGTSIYPIRFQRSAAVPYRYATLPKWARAAFKHITDEDSTVYVTKDLGVGNAGIEGVVTDNRGRPIVNAAVEVFLGTINGRECGGVVTNYDGEYVVSPLEPGIYTVVVTYLGNKEIVNQVRVSSGIPTQVNVKIGTSKELKEVMVRSYKTPLVNPKQPGSTTIKTSSQISHMAVQNVDAIASLSPGVYQNNSRGGLNIGGGRTSGTKYIVDGVQLPPGDAGITNLPPSAIEDVTDDSRYLNEGGQQFLKSDKAKAFMNDFMSNFKAASGIRKTFRDWAIWEPDLWTDAQGNTSFKVKYPDNITSWKTYVLAMNEKGFSGKVLQLTRAFKPLSAELSAPRFLRYGDTAEVIGKVANYTPQPFHLQTRFQQATNAAVTDTATVFNTRVNTLLAEAPTTNSADTALLPLSYSIHADNGYEDGEERTLPIYPVGVVTTQGSFVPMLHDTTFTTVPDTAAGRFTGRVRILADASLADAMLREIEHLKEYPYGCNEQLTTKLLAIYYEEEIKRTMHNVALNNEKAKRKILDQLVGYQHTDGSFGWWYDGPADYRITNYVISTLQKVNKDGWLDFIIRRGLRYLSGGVDDMKTSDQIATLATLSAAHIAANYKTLLAASESERLSIYDRFQVVKIRKEQGLPYRKQLDSLVTERRETINGTYWGRDSYDWYRDELATTVSAYQLLQDDSIYSPLAGRILNYLLFRREDGGYYSNTASSGLVLSTVLPIILQHTDTAYLSKPTYLKITGSLNDSTTTFPKTYEVHNGHPSFTISKRGFSPAFVSVAYEYLDIHPKANDSNFEVHTYYVKGRDTVTSLKAGEKAEIHVTVRCKRESDYVMINVPIPAGCIQGNKERYGGGVDDARQNFKDQTALFCNHLYQSTFTFIIPIEARYKGVYNISPARAGMMYYPLQFGNEQVKKMKIR